MTRSTEGTTAPSPDPNPPSRGRGRGSTLGRAAWGIADQALSSLTNFGLAVAVAHQVGPNDFGAFAIAFAVYLVALSISRAVATDPLTIRYSTATPERWRGATGSSTGVAFVAGVASAAIAIPVGLGLGGAVGLSLVCLGIGLPALLVQDAWRYAFFAARRGRAAFVNDLVWTVALIVGFGALIVTGQASVGAFILAWAAGALAGALVGIAQAGVLPRPTHTRAWWREHHDIAPRLAAEAAVLSGAQPLTLAAMGLVSTLVTVGTIRAGQALMNGIHVATYGIQLFAVPEGVRTLERSSGALVRFCLIVAGVLAAIAAAWGTVLILLPESIGSAILGASWASAQTVLLPSAVLSMVSGVQAGALVGLRSLAAAPRSLRARVVSSLAVSIGGILGVIVGGPVAGAWGLALGLSVGAAFWWSQFLRAIDERGRHPRRSPEPAATSPDTAATVLAAD